MIVPTSMTKIMSSPYPDYTTVGVATGVYGTGLDGTYPTNNSRDYLYCETTGDGFAIGKMPLEYEVSSVRVVNC
jgi:predicted Rossmann fold nucleotide-binding protein DprA/Smf involved in DNA uptake